MKQTIVQYLMVIALIVGAYFVGVYKTKVEYLEKGTTDKLAQVAGDETQQTPQSVDIEKIKGLFDGKHITFGDRDAKLIFTEVSDTSCPYCHIAGGLNPELNAQVGSQFKMKKDGGSYVPPMDEIRKLVDAKKASFVWLYSPGHGNGELGTIALYCAYEKGKFWEAHDLLMTNKAYSFINETVQNDLKKSGEMAEFLKSAVNPRDMKDCIDSGKYTSRNTEDTAFVQGLGFGATPTFFVNDKVVEGAASWDTSFKSIVDSLI